MSDKRTIASSLQNVEHLAIIEDILADRFDSIDLQKLLIYLIDIVDVDALPFLAEQFDVLGNKGFGLASTEQEKREVIKRAIELHRYKGTVYSVREAMKSVGFPDAEIVERPAGYESQYGARHAYTFRVLIRPAYDETIAGASINLLTKIITEYKNVRSHLIDVAVILEFADQARAIEEDEIILNVAYETSDDFDMQEPIYNGEFEHNGEITYGADNEVLEYNCTILGTAFDSDADAYLDMIEYQDLCVGGYQIHKLVKQLKEDGIWNKLIAIYPMLNDGINKSRAFQNSINLRDPRDLDIAKRLTFAGNMEHVEGGIKFNGIGLARTFITKSDFIAKATAQGLPTRSNYHMGVYTRTTGNGTEIILGQGPNVVSTYLQSQRVAGAGGANISAGELYGGNLIQTFPSVPQGNNNPAIGFTSINKESTTTNYRYYLRHYFNNNTQASFGNDNLITGGIDETNEPDELYLGFASTRENNFFTFANFLSLEQSSDLRTSIRLFNLALNRL